MTSSGVHPLREIDKHLREVAIEICTKLDISDLRQKDTITLLNEIKQRDENAYQALKSYLDSYKKYVSYSKFSSSKNEDEAAILKDEIKVRKDVLDSL